MDIPILIALALSAVIIVYLIYVKSTTKKPEGNVNVQEENVQEEVVEQSGNARAATGRRAGGLSRMANLRNRNQPADQNNNDALDAPDYLPEDQEGNEEEEDGEESLKKIGKKKMAKLQMKEEKRQQREAIEEMREQKKAREENEREEQKKKEQQREEEERLQQEEEEKRRIEREKREEEEYQQWKLEMEVEKAGTIQQEHEERQNRLGEFIQYIMDRKVVQLEDLASEFNMKTMEVIEQLHKLDEEGKISGVIDDRGKFICITREEMEKVANFIKRKGRVTIDDIARESNRLVKLT